jgi:flagellar motility protein MotE (MotC chaperone)
LAIVLTGVLVLRSLSVIDSVSDLVSAPAQASAPDPEPSYDDEDAAEEGSDGQSDEAPPSRPEILNQSRYDRGGGARIPTASQLALETDLAQRRRQLNEREQALDTREQLFQVAESRFDERLGQLTELRDEIRGLLGQLDDRRQQQIDAIVDTITTMEAEPAAALLTQMRQSDPETLLVIAESLNTEDNRRKFSAILSATTPELNAWLMVEIHKRAQLDESLRESEARDVVNAEG